MYYINTDELEDGEKTQCPRCAANGGDRSHDNFHFYSKEDGGFCYKCSFTIPSEEYKEESNHIRHTDKWKEIYPRRKETIERCFADAKTKHGMGFTRHIGKQKVCDDVYLIFAAMNMKKMATYLSKRSITITENFNILLKLVKSQFFFFKN